MPEPLPDWLVNASATPRENTPRHSTEALIVNYEAVFPRVLELMAGGCHLNRAIKRLPADLYPPVKSGPFIQWVNKDPLRKTLFKQAKEIRTETWAGNILDHAEGVEDGFENDTARSKLIIDTYWKLMGVDNRKDYGDKTTIEVTGGISITAALSQASNRLRAADEDSDDRTIDAQMVELLSDGGGEGDDE